MMRGALRFLGLLALVAALGGCDKCADYFIVNPFAPTKPPPACHEEPVQR